MENIEIVVGTYENLILGYTIIKQLKGDYSVELSFTDDSHRGALRCMSVSPNGTLVSGSTDDSIRLHSLTKRKDIGGLFEHTGTVNSISFYGNTHMFSASEDGTICIWRCRSWEMLRTLKGHKAHVTSMAAHPSGKLGLSVGSDKSFLTWDLVTGKLAFQRKLKEMAQSVLFTPSGDHYILVYQRNVEVCSLEDTSTVKEIPTSWRINSVCFVNDEVIAIGGDNESVLIVNVLSGNTVLTLNCIKPDEIHFSSRVRCVCTTKIDDMTLVIAGMANGNLAVFKVTLSEETGKSESELIIFYEAKVRVTCMALHNLTEVKAKETEDRDAEPLIRAQKRKKKRNTRQEDNEETLEDKTESGQETLEDKTESGQETQEDKSHQTAYKNTKIKSQKQGKDKKRKLDDNDDQMTKEKESGKLEKETKPLSRNIKRKRKQSKK